MICGIELSGSEARMCLVEGDEDEWEVHDVPTRKVVLDDSENSSRVKSAASVLEAFFKEHNPNRIVIKQRNVRGKYAGGAATFKLEGMIQLVGNVDVEILNSNAISAALKNVDAEPPDDLRAYQREAFRTALAAHLRP